jgi:hypothetical protein
MKRIKFGILALASITGLSAAFAFTPAKSFAPLVYAIKLADGTYSYTSVDPSPLAFSCTTSTEACTITTTIPVSTLNANFKNTFPAESSSPYVNYITPNRVHRAL